MLSLELAKKLKEAGLCQTLKYGDLFYHGRENDKCIFGVTVFDDSIFPPRRTIRAPRLDQLLAEIERRGYELQLHIPCPSLALFSSNGFLLETFAAETPEDAAGQALLWILEREKEASP